MESGMSRLNGRTSLVQRKSGSRGSRKTQERISPPRPGDVLRVQIFATTNITQERLADDMKVSRYSINQLVNNRRAVTPEMALRLAKATSTAPEFWLNLQRNFDL